MTFKERISFQKALKLFHQPFFDLLEQAHTVTKRHFPDGKIHISALLSIKTGGCSEDCAYCSQSAHHKTATKPTPLMSLDKVIEMATRAKKSGATRFCMGASGRGPKEAELEKILSMIREVKKLRLECCVTLGLINYDQAQKLKQAGLDYYNHNIDTSADFYPKIITTRTFQDRLTTLEHVRRAGIKICSGGIIGLGESQEDRIRMIVFLANMEEPFETIPINKLIPFPGTPLQNAKEVDSFEFIRVIALARLAMPKSIIRLSAGREKLSDEAQALAFFAGANSIFYGEKLLTCENRAPEKDLSLLARLDLKKHEIKM